MSDDIERIYGWPVNTPIPMQGGGVAYVVCECAGLLELVLSGYFLGPGGLVHPIQWTENGEYAVDAVHSHDLDPSCRVLPEPKLPLWTMADSEVLLGKILRSKHACEVSMVHKVCNDGLLSMGGIRRIYAYVSDNYTHLDGTPIPQRMMP